MATEQPSRRKTYIIPDNFIDEGRIINGMFRTRYFVEAVILAVIAAMFALLIPVEKVTNKITLVVFIAGPFFALGITGISGDPLSVAAKNVVHWIQTRSLMLYDSNPRALVTTPLDKMMNQTLTKDQILEYIERSRQQRLEKRAQEQLIEDENFRFAADKDYAREYVDPNQVDQEIELIIIDDEEEDLDLVIDPTRSMGRFVSVPNLDTHEVEDAWDDLDFLDETTVSIKSNKGAALDFDILEGGFFDGSQEE